MKLDTAVAQFLEERAASVTAGTITWYRRQLDSLVDVLGGVDIKAVTVLDLHRWKQSLQRRNAKWKDHPGRPTEVGNLSPKTIRGYVRAVRIFFRWLHLEKAYIDVDPSARLSMPDRGKRTVKAISEENIAKMLDAARAHSARDCALLRMARDTGARVGGLVSMKVSDVDLGRRRVTVHEKGDKSRAVFFRAETAEALRLYLRYRDDDSESLWIGQQGPLTKSGVYQIFSETAKRAGVPKPYNPHAFRHALAIRLLQNGADAAMVRDILGHSSAQVTLDTYAVHTVDALQERYDEYMAG